MERVLSIEEVTVDLRICNEGMSCEEYSLLIIAGPDDMPPSVKVRMERHQGMCEYHQSEAFHQSALSAPVTKELEQAAQEVVEKYNML